MTSGLFESKSEINARAVFLAQRIELRAFRHTQKLASNPLVITSGASGCVVLFRYGVVVMFGLTAMEEASFLAEIQQHLVEPFTEGEAEQLELLKAEKDEGVEPGVVRLKTFSVEHIQIIADVLAKSVVLAHYEQATAKTFDHIEPLAMSLQQGQRSRVASQELLSHIGDILSIQGKMVGRVEVGDKPEILWEHPELEKIYARLEDEYEVRERHLALERKFALISRTVETLLDLLQYNRSLRVEWYIVILIVIDIIVSLAQEIF